MRYPYPKDYSLGPIICKICGKPIKQSEAFGLDSFHDNKSFYCQKCCEQIDYRRGVGKNE